MANKDNEIVITVTVHPGMTFWDALKMRIAGKGSEIFWNALAKKISEPGDDRKECEKCGNR